MERQILRTTSIYLTYESLSLIAQCVGSQQTLCLSSKAKLEVSDDNARVLAYEL